MLSALSALDILFKLGDWAIEIFKIIRTKKDEQREKDASPPVTSPSALPDKPSGASVPMSKQPPEPPNDVPPEPTEEPPKGLVLPPPPSVPSSEPEFGTDEYLTQLLTEIYKNKRSDEEIQVGIGNTDELKQNGEQ